MKIEQLDIFGNFSTPLKKKSTGQSEIGKIVFNVGATALKKQEWRV